MPETAPSDWRRFAGVGLSQKALKAAAARKAEIRHAIRVSAAVGAAFALATLLRLPQGYWAVFTAVIVTQTSVGGSVSTGIDRLIGTIGGVAYSVAILTVMPHDTWPDIAIAIAVALFPLAFLSARYSSFRVAPVTAIILLLAPTRGITTARP